MAVASSTRVLNLKSGLTAITRIMDFLMVAIGVKLAVSGIVGLVNSLH